MRQAPLAGLQRGLTCAPLHVQYQMGESVRLWVNKVGPYNNPQETYNYYYLPFCKPDAGEKPAHKWGGLGEVLQGNELIDSQLDIKYRSALSLNCPASSTQQLWCCLGCLGMWQSVQHPALHGQPAGHHS